MRIEGADLLRSAFERLALSMSSRPKKRVWSGNGNRRIHKSAGKVSASAQEKTHPALGDRMGFSIA